MKIKILLMTMLICLPLYCVKAEEQIITPIEDSSFQTNETLDVKENILGNAFYFGNNVISNSTISGIGFIAGNNVTIEGKKEYLFAAGNNLYIKGNIEDDAFLAGNMVDISGNINRDLYIASSIVNIRGNIGRKVRIYASEVILDGIFGENIEICATKIIIKEQAIIHGVLKYNADAVIEISEKATIGKIETYETKKEENIGLILRDNFLNFLSSYANLLVIALVIIYLVPKLFEKIKENYGNNLMHNYFKLFMKGLIFMIGVPFLIILLLSTYISTSLAIILIPFYIIMVYISTIFTGYLVGYFLLKVLKKEYNIYTTILLGVAVVKLLEFIPYLGIFISMISLFVGLGMMIDVFWRGRQKA